MSLWLVARFLSVGIRVQPSENQFAKKTHFFGRTDKERRPASINMFNVTPSRASESSLWQIEVSTSSRGHFRTMSPVDLAQESVHCLEVSLVRELWLRVPDVSEFAVGTTNIARRFS